LDTVFNNSPLIEQHIQPLFNSIISSEPSIIKSLSIPISPNSFT